MRLALFLTLILSGFLIACSSDSPDSSSTKIKNDTSFLNQNKKLKNNLKKNKTKNNKANNKKQKNKSKTIKNNNLKRYPKYKPEEEFPYLGPSITRKGLFITVLYRLDKKSKPRVAKIKCPPGKVCGGFNLFREVDFQKRSGRCSSIYAGPEIVLIQGRLGKKKIKARFSRDDGCSIEQFETVIPLLLGLGLYK